MRDLVIQLLILSIGCFPHAGHLSEKAKKAATSKLGVTQKRKATQRAVASLQRHLSDFRIRLEYHGPRPESHPSVWLGVPAVPKPLADRYIALRISKGEAETIIEHLAESGFLWRGITNREKSIRLPDGPYYTWYVEAKRCDTYFEHLPVGEELVQRLKNLRSVLDGDAAQAVGKILTSLGS